MTRLLLFVVPLVIGLAAHGAESSRPTGTNCLLTSPPPAAGEEQSHGSVLLVYPRAKDITKDYSGCQVLFLPNGDGWTVMSVTEILNGTPVRLWSSDNDIPELMACSEENGKTASDMAETCAAADSLLIRSLAPGCVQKIKEGMQAGGLSAPIPTGCEYE